MLSTCGFVSSGNTGTSIEQFKANFTEVMQNQGDDSDMSYLASIYKALNSKQYDKAIQEAEKFRNMRPGDNNVYLLEGYAYMGKKEYLSSTDRFSHIIDSDNTRGDAYFFRAQNYLLSEQPEKALTDIAKALDNKQMPAQVVQIYKNLGEKNIDTEKVTGFAFNMKAEAYRQLGQFTLAMDNANKAIEYHATSSILYKLRGELYLSQQNYSLAYKDLTKTVELDSSESNALFLMGLISLFQGNYDIAVEQYQKANQLIPEKMIILRYMSLAYWLQGNEIKAFETIEKALKGKPNPIHFYHLAYFHHLSGNKDMALVNFKKAYKLKPDILKTRAVFMNRPPVSSP
ncbi:MAG: hypothetical protein KAI17_11070, partial [Thiotrichaceae bacterium]|nr:hypothetical protein [Thiotrichaceae bacterium]